MSIFYFHFFLTSIQIQVRTQLSLTKLLDAICASMVQKENWEEICGDLHAVRIIGQTGGFPKSSKENLKRSPQCVLQKSKDFANEGKPRSSFQAENTFFIRIFLAEESPPKKRKLEAPPSKTNQTVEEKDEAEAANKIETKDEKPLTEPSDETKVESDAKEATTSTATVATTASSRNDLIKDIESHIEIIYECLDELNETAINTTGSGSTSMSKTTSSELMVSSEASSHDETTPDEGEKSTEKEEPKNE